MTCVRLPPVNTNRISPSLLCVRQNGISLVIVMIFLVILSVLGISAMQTSTLSSRIARNEADRNIAFQAAEAAMRDAYLDIKNLRFDGVNACNTGMAGCRATELTSGASFFGYDVTADPAANPCKLGRCEIGHANQGAVPFWENTGNWTGTDGSVTYGLYTGATALPIVAQQPRYLIEVFTINAGAAYVYRVTTVGYGANASTQVMLQSTVKIKGGT
jgi:type IV pilus assembly protein PilX